MFQDPGLCPGHSPIDPVYGNLQVVFSFIFWSSKIITAERAQQQGQEQIEDLKQDQEQVQDLKQGWGQIKGLKQDQEQI